MCPEIGTLFMPKGCSGVNAFLADPPTAVGGSVQTSERLELFQRMMLRLRSRQNRASWLLNSTKVCGMKQLAFGLMLAMAASCGNCGDETSSNNDNSANNTTNNATNNETNNMTGNTTGTFIGWTIEVEGGAVDLPSIEGTMMTADGQVSYTEIEGTADGAQLVMQLAGGEPVVRDFEDPRQFEVTWDDPNYRCRGGEELVVSVTTIDPNPQGTFSGPISCSLVTDPSDSFEATTTGTFGFVVE